jgi:hypothetical protein
MTDLLKEQQEAFKEQVEELYHLNNKMSERIKAFSAQQADLLRRNEQNLKEIQSDITTKLQNEAFRFEQARREIAEDMSWNRFRAYGLYILYTVVLAAVITNIWVGYTDITKQPGVLNDICLNMARGKVVVIDPKSISKEKVDGEEITLARIVR